MNILPKKSWHVRNKDNIARVRRDEANAAEEEREIRRRVERAEQEARTEYLRGKARAALCKAEECESLKRIEDRDVEGEHLNLFPIEDAGQKRGNEEYLKEKKDEKERQERAIGLLVSLGPAPGTEATPWYMRNSGRRGEDGDGGPTKGREKSSPCTAEEKQKKDRKLKDNLDPLKDMKKALAIKDKDRKSERRGKVKGGEKRGVESSLERLRAERLQREAEERRRAQALLEQRSGGVRAEDQHGELHERDRPYNSAYFPELARKRQRRDTPPYSL